MKITLVNARNKYGDFWKHGPRVLNRFFRNRTLQFKNLTYEKPVVDLITGGGYDLMLDVGAGWGYHTIIAAHHMKHVIAVEANPLRFGLLTWNTQLLTNVQRRCEFVGRLGQKVRRPGNPIRPTEKIHPEIPLSAVTLESIALRLPYAILAGRMLVKIDVEGSEFDVLAGAPSLRKNKRVDWIVELHSRVDGITEAGLDAMMAGKSKKQITGKQEKHFFYWSER